MADVKKGKKREKQPKNAPQAPEGESRYINRELSWLHFNRRVLAEAENPNNPLLERIKFLAIFEGNLDEFYMVRVSGLIEQESMKLNERSPDGLTASEQLELIARTVRPMRAHAAEVWSKDLKPALAAQGVKVVALDSTSLEAKRDLADYFQRVVFPVCTPLLLEPAITFPFISNRSLNLVVELKDEAGSRLARVKIPTVVPRLVPVPGRAHTFVMLEDLIATHLGSLFPGVEVVGASMFRVVRDADIEIRELEASDLISAVEQTLRLRRFGDPVFLEISSTMPASGRRVLMKGLELDAPDVFTVDGDLGMEFLWELARVPLPALKFNSHAPYHAERLRTAKDLFATVREQDVLLYHPYDGFQSVEQYVAAAADDPDVLGIKMTLYRVGSESPIVESLLRAAENGKQVAAMVELKARFDESNNLVWSRALERAGVHVTYGMFDLKVHCKLAVIVRRDADRIRTYVHVGTGNFNPSTARLYTDLALLTCDESIAQDATELFNFLTGFSRQMKYRKLLVAPLNLREEIIARIEREVENYRATGTGRIAFKLNSLVDPEVIDALYEASQAGVTIDLHVRGICCLRPGVPGLSENIRLLSVVGRFLEHARIYYFENRSEPEAFIGSADMMRRNLDRRIEVLAPVRQANHLSYLRDEVFGSALEDSTNAWEGQPDGTYVRVTSPEGAFSSQVHLISNPAGRMIPHDEMWVTDAH